MRVIVLIVVLLVSGCRAEAACDPELYSLVQDVLFKRLGTGSVRYEPETIVAQQQAKITEIRKWALKLKDPCIRKEYIGWLDFYQNRLNGDVKENKQRKAERDYAEKHAIPEPPK